MKKNIISLLVLLLTAATGAWANEVTIGDGTGTTYQGPFNSLWGYSLVETIYTADQIGKSGPIISITYKMEGENNSQTNSIDIYMKNVSRSSFDSASDFESLTEADMVFSGEVTFEPGYTTITLDTPFDYDDTKNLLIAMHEKASGYSTRYFYYTEKSNRLLSFHSDSYNPNPSSLGSFPGDSYVEAKLPNIIINIEDGIGGETGDCKWNYAEDTKTLTISGRGAMGDYADAADCPWAEFAKDVETVIIKEGVTHIGDRAFHSMKKLTFTTIASTVESIGDYAFYNCVELPFVSIPSSVTDMGKDAFWLCLRLRNVYMYADVDNLTWLDTDCDDFTTSRHTTCHVASDKIQAWQEKYGLYVNVVFKGDIEPVPAAYANEDAYKLTIRENAHGKATFYVDGSKASEANAGAPVMVVVEPQEGYIAELVCATGYMLWKDAAARAATSINLIGGSLDVEKLKESVWAFAMPGADVDVDVVYRKLLSNADITVDAIDAAEYTGVTQTPAVTVRDNGAELTEGKDFKVEYTQTVAAGETVIKIMGIGEYAGEITTSYTITPKSADGLTVEVGEAAPGEVPALTVKYGELTLAEGYEYTVEYSDADGNAVTEEQMKQGGTYTATITLEANYMGQLEKTFSVTAPEEEPATGIAATGVAGAKAEYYGLDGRRLTGKAKGLVVVKGKKMVIK